MDGQRCVACGGRDLHAVEAIAATDIADGWYREDIANGRVELAAERAAALRALLPDEILFDRCARCGLEMARPAVAWDAGQYPEHSYPVRWEFLRCAADLGSAPLDILELGCGTGEFLAIATARGHRAVGIDFGAAPVAAARARGLTAFESSLEGLDEHLPTGSRFDAIVFFQLIEHVPDPDAFFDAIAQRARPGARLFLACPGPRRYTRIIAEQQVGRSDFWDYPPQHVLRWTLPALEAVATRHGWTPIISIEEPLDWIGAASHIGVARAIHRGRLADPIRRRLTIVAAWASLAGASRSRRRGTSLYFAARRN